MIAQLTGTIVEKIPPEIVLNVGGVGYEVQLPMTSFYQLPEVDHTVSIFTHFVVREDAQLLFGFVDRAERSLFRVLIKANGVGPKLACAILSGMSSDQFISAVMNEDISALVKMPGVGKKTAERLVVELKDKLKDIDAVALPNNAVALQSSQSVLSVAPSATEEAISALVALGYKRNQAESSVKAVVTEDATSEQLIRDALKNML